MESEEESQTKTVTNMTSAKLRLRRLGRDHEREVWWEPLTVPRQICIIERKWGCLTMLMEDGPIIVWALCLYFVYYLKSSSRQQTSSEAPCGNIARDEVQSIQSEAGTFGQHKNRNRNWLFVLSFCSMPRLVTLTFPAFPRKLDVDDFYILNVRSLLYKITVLPPPHVWLLWTLKVSPKLHLLLQCDSYSDNFAQQNLYWDFLNSKLWLLNQIMRQRQQFLQKCFFWMISSKNYFQ